MARIPFPVDTPEEARARAKFEQLASDPSYKFARSRRGTYVNGALARDWKWFCLGMIHHQESLPDAALAAPVQPAEVAEPIDMVLHCPACGMQHVDAAERQDPYPSSTGEDDHAPWHNPPHRSHLCHGCGHIWRPADVPTNGVQAAGTQKEGK